MKNTNTSVRFTLNFANKTIVGSKASFDKAGKGFGPIYDELADLMAKHPTYGVEIKAPKKPAKPKRTYAGMDVRFILDFFHAAGLEDEADALEKALAYAEANSISKYPLAKRFLFDAVPAFDYAAAKEEVAEYRHTRLLALSGAETAKETVSADDNKADLSVEEAA